jgi:hypothetical protein
MAKLHYILVLYIGRLPLNNHSYITYSNSLLTITHQINNLPSVDVRSTIGLCLVNHRSYLSFLGLSLVFPWSILSLSLVLSLSQFPIAYFFLPIANCLTPTANCLLPKANCLFPKTPVLYASI